ncbi:MAG: alkaline phosphatase [Halioglobus sp.]
MTKTPDYKRRTILKGLAASSLIPLLGSNLIGCSDGNDNAFANPAEGPDFVSILADFLHGVASGDPLSDAVILWTRVTPQAQGRAWVSWEVAMDDSFTDIVTTGAGETGADVDYTVKVDVTGLTAGTQYYYRFKIGDNTSSIGRTKTLPEGSASSATFAVVSCSNYPAGYFNVYREVANQDLDAVLHLGDYLYEYSRTGYASENAAALGREVEPEGEILTLSDYRLRYAQYHTDEDLQAAHAAHPFFIVWDDHEVANDAWRDGAQNHTEGEEGSFVDRRMAAIQAWYEWLPVRPPSSMQEIIYRRFAFGDLIDLLMLDTRIIGRDEQYEYSDFATDSMIDVAAARAAFGDSNRTLLGAEQLAWLRDALSSSSAKWQVLGQQVLFGRYQLPAPIMEALDPGLNTPDGLTKGTAAVLEAITAKNKAPVDRTADEQALLDSAIPYNLDAWDGYEFERDALLTFAQQSGSKLVALAGDTHNAWNAQLTTADGDIVGVEFATASVTSPGLDGVLGEANSGLFAPLVTTLVDDLKGANLLRRGYLYLEFSDEEVMAEHRFVTTIDSKEYTLDEGAALSFVVNRGDMVLA